MRHVICRRRRLGSLPRTLASHLPVLDTQLKVLGGMELLETTGGRTASAAAWEKREGDEQ